MPTLPVRRIKLPKRTLMNHQFNCMEWTRNCRIDHPALYLEMRLGKTLTAIRTVTQIWNCNGPCLVVAPVTVLEAWEKELTLEGEQYVVASGLSMFERVEAAKLVHFSGRRLWMLINYDALRVTPGFAKLDWDFVALDESTVIKNNKAKISQLVCAGFRTAKHRMILSGLPSPEGQLNLFQQFKFLHGKFMGHDNFYKWRAQYFEPADMYGSGWSPKSGASKLIKAEVQRSAFIMRRQDAGIGGKKIRETRTVPMKTEQEKAYSSVEKDFSVWLDRGELEVQKETQYVIVQQMWLSRIAGGCDADGKFCWDNKQKELVDLMTGELAGEPTVIWYRFNTELLADKEALLQAGVEAKELIGTSERDVRKSTLEWFRTSKNRNRVLLCQIKLAKYGVDCSVADTAIYRSMSYSCEEIAQSEDRIFHPMKKSPLLYIYLVSRDSIDQDIMYAVNNKVTSAKLFMMKVNESILKRRNA